MPDPLDKGLLGEIICRGELDFVDHDKDGHQEEEKDSNNDASVLSYYEEKRIRQQEWIWGW